MKKFSPDPVGGMQGGKYIYVMSTPLFILLYTIIIKPSQLTTSVWPPNIMILQPVPVRAMHPEGVAAAAHALGAARGS